MIISLSFGVLLWMARTISIIYKKNNFILNFQALPKNWGQLCHCDAVTICKNVSANWKKRDFLLVHWRGDLLGDDRDTLTCLLLLQPHQQSRIASKLRQISAAQYITLLFSFFWQWVLKLKFLQLLKNCTIISKMTWKKKKRHRAST